MGVGLVGLGLGSPWGKKNVFFLGGDLGKANKESKSFLGGKRKGGGFPEYSTVIYFLSIRRYVSCIKTQWRFSLQPPTLHATFCET